jgi:hypothetical protein
MRELAPLLPGGDEYPWSNSRLIRRRPDVDDDDGIDVQEDSPDPTPLAQYTAVEDDDGNDVIAEPPLSDLERLYSEYQHSRIYPIKYRSHLPNPVARGFSEPLVTSVVRHQVSKSSIFRGKYQRRCNSSR